MHKNVDNTNKHIAELLLRIKELERSRHEMEQLSQEETLQLRERLRTEKHDLHVRCASPSCLHPC